MGNRGVKETKNEEQKENSNVPKRTKSWKDVYKHRIGVETRHGEFITTVGDQALVSACRIEGGRKDQDRFVCIPHFSVSPNVVFCALADGHGVEGCITAELACSELPKHIWNLMHHHEWNKTNVEKTVISSFESVQDILSRQYDIEVLEPTLKVKKQIESQHKVNLGRLSLPLGSGTTATIVLLFQDVLCVANVGDTRAVLCKREGEETIVQELTLDHNVASSSEEELNRVHEAGGDVVGRHLCGDYIDGMLQLTRSLGDVPLHRNGIVLETPEVHLLDITDAFKFVVLGSDGLWDYVSSHDACTYVYDNFFGSEKLEREDATFSDQVRLSNICAELISQAVKGANERGHQVDDISVMIIASRPETESKEGKE